MYVGDPEKLWGPAKSSAVRASRQMAMSMAASVTPGMRPSINAAGSLGSTPRRDAIKRSLAALPPRPPRANSRSSGSAFGRYSLTGIYSADQRRCDDAIANAIDCIRSRLSKASSCTIAVAWSEVRKAEAAVACGFFRKAMAHAATAASYV